ncbi:MAG: hypothetical protein KDA80_22145 [Planctomycetaceae bacterium]|nr:hypothetical protein [Planctomycetaceae bacterium]
MFDELLRSFHYYASGLQEETSGPDPVVSDWFADEMVGIARILFGLSEKDGTRTKGKLPYRETAIHAMAAATAAKRLNGQKSTIVDILPDIVAFKVASDQAIAWIHALRLAKGFPEIDADEERSTRQGSWAASERPDGSQAWHSRVGELNPVFGTLETICHYVGPRDPKTLRAWHA